MTTSGYQVREIKGKFKEFTEMVIRIPLYLQRALDNRSIQVYSSHTSIRITIVQGT